MKVTWLDGKNADNHYVLQIHYGNSKYGFLKNTSYEWISHYYNLFWDCPEVVGLTIFDKNQNAVATKYRAAAA